MKKVQTKGKGPKQKKPAFQDHDDILCDGCDRHIKEEKYIQHWQVCIKVKRKNKKTANQSQKKEEQAKNTEKQQRQFLPQEKMNELYGVRRCNQCGLEVEGGVRGMEAHNSVCAQRLVECEYCYEQYPPYLIEEHHLRCDLKRAIEESLKDQTQTTQQRYQSRPTQPSGSLNGVQIFEELFQSAEMSEEQIYERLLSGSSNQAPPAAQRAALNQRRQNDNSDLLEEYFKALRKKATFTEAQFKALKRGIFSHEQERQNCTICQEQFEQGQPTVTLECNHFFHEDCLHDWLKKAAICPNCNKQLKSQ